MHERLSYFWRRSGLSQVQLAERAGVDQSMVSRWMNGKTLPTHGNLERVVRAMGISMSKFWGARVPARRADV